MRAPARRRPKRVGTAGNVAASPAAMTGVSREVAVFSSILDRGAGEGNTRHVTEERVARKIRNRRAIFPVGWLSGERKTSRPEGDRNTRERTVVSRRPAFHLHHVRRL